MVPRRNSMTAFDYFIVPNLCTHHLLELCVTQGEIVFELHRACLTEQCKRACKRFVVFQSSFQNCFHLKFHLSTLAHKSPLRGGQNLNRSRRPPNPGGRLFKTYDSTSIRDRRRTQTDAFDPARMYLASRIMLCYYWQPI